jgi:hypothetical protein
MFDILSGLALLCLLGLELQSVGVDCGCHEAIPNRFFLVFAYELKCGTACAC